jgi:hypothetical protein
MALARAAILAIVLKNSLDTHLHCCEKTKLIIEVSHILKSTFVYRPLAKSR